MSFLQFYNFRKVFQTVCSSLLAGLLLLVFSIINPAQAVHIKAGEITVRNLDGNTRYEITLTLYFDSLQILQNPSLAENTALIDFGDGTVRSVPVTAFAPAGNGTIKKTYITVYDFKFPNTYTISYRQDNRNEHIVNINGKEGSLTSDDYAFYIETFIFIDNLLGPIASPRLTFPPIDNATPGQIFTHNPGADPVAVGDSISYEFAVPKIGRNQPVPKYVDPDDPQYNGVSVEGGPSQLDLDPVTGDLVWNTPSSFFSPGVDYAHYNVAIKISQWRKLNNGQYILVSYVIRDMQITVRKLPNKRPEIRLPKDTCIAVSANSLIQDTIYVSDPDSIDPFRQRVILTVFSEIIPPATLRLNSPSGRNPLPNPSTATFTWQPGCTDVRLQPYIVTFKAEDNVVPSIRLATYKSRRIRVFGDKPDSLSVQLGGPGALLLNWKKYFCNNADSILIYRKDCSIDSFIPSACDPLGIVAQGFRQVGSASITSTSFLDNKNIKSGSNYCYVIIARFPGGVGNVKFLNGLSFPSEQVCFGYFNETVLMTNVSVQRTDLASGAVQIRWRNGLASDTTGDIEYRLFRSDQQIGGIYTQVFTTRNRQDTSYTDLQGPVNTENKTYSYFLQVAKAGTILFNTDTASSVFLNVTAGSSRILLTWSSRVPWDNQLYHHYVYRKRNSDTTYTLIDSVSVIGNIGRYNDNAITNKDTFCYFVETRGRYCFQNLTPILVNRSQEACAIPRDSLPPCAPVLSLVDEDCSTPTNQRLPKPLRNFLSWIRNTNAGCNNDILGFNLYFAPHDGDPFVKIATISKDSLSFIDEDDFSQAGCYAVTAFNFYGIESDKSNIECNDNCTYYELPNLITVNSDTLNSTFRAFNYPRGVAEVQLYIYNRWGGLIHYQNNPVGLNWTPDKQVSDGIYYYLAKIRFERRRRAEDEQQEIKGWLQVISSEPAAITK